MSTLRVRNDKIGFEARMFTDFIAYSAGQSFNFIISALGRNGKDMRCDAWPRQYDYCGCQENKLR